MARLLAIALGAALLTVPVIGSPVAAATPKCDGLKATIVGTNGAETIRGTAKRDVIVAKGGRDRIYGRGGNDVICAGNGKDLVFGGAGSDRLFGGDKSDTLKGGSGYDRLNGGSGRDACYVDKNGGTKVSCETAKADLTVSVQAPTTVAIGETFTIWVFVRNIGAKTASGVKVVVDYAETNVTCRLPMDPSGSYKPLNGTGVMKPTAYWTRAYTQHCQMPIGSPATATMSVSVSTDSAEDTKLNNSATRTVTVIDP